MYTDKKSSCLHKDQPCLLHELILSIGIGFCFVCSFSISANKIACKLNDLKYQNFISPALEVRGLQSRHGKDYFSSEEPFPASGIYLHPLTKILTVGPMITSLTDFEPFVSSYKDLCDYIEFTQIGHNEALSQCPAKCSWRYTHTYINKNSIKNSYLPGDF